MSDVMLSASDRLVIDDRCVLGKPGAFVGVANLGVSQTELGAGVQAHSDVVSRGDVSFLRSQSHVFGKVATSGTVLQQDNVVVDGGIEEFAEVQPRTVSWSIEFPVGSDTDISLPPDAPNHDLAPGSYDSIQAFSRSTLTLRAGEYYINSLVLEPDVHFRIDTSHGPVQIYVKETLRLTPVKGSRPRARKTAPSRSLPTIVRDPVVQRSTPAKSTAGFSKAELPSFRIAAWSARGSRRLVSRSACSVTF